MKRRASVILGVVILLLFAGFGALASAFMGLKQAKDGTLLPGGATLVRDGFVNAFILPAGDGQAALIDCGQDKDARALKAHLEDQHLTVSTIFLTHGHGDHTGGCLAFPGAQIFGLEADRGLIEGTASAHGPLTRFTKGDPAHSPKLTRALTNGEIVHVGDIDVQAFAVPGHTAGSAAYLSNRVLYLGDSLAAQTDGTVRLAPWIFSDDLDTTRASVVALAKRLANEKIDMLAFSHSGPLDGVRPLLDFH